MGRYRSRSRSLSPRRTRSPPRRKQYDEPRDRHRGGGGRSYRDGRSSPPTGLLIRNISLGARPEDLRIPFERFGPVKDVYLPKNYYTGEPRGFGFVKYRNGEDAAEAKHQMNHQVIGGREITIVYAEENRKTPQEMRTTPRTSGRSGGGYKRRTSPRSPRRQHRSYSLSPSPPRRESRDRNHGARDYSPRRSISRSPSPKDERNYKSDRMSPGPRGKGPMRSPSPKRTSRSLIRSTSPRGRIQSPVASPSPRGRESPNPRGRIRSPVRSPSPRGRASPNPRGRVRSPMRSPSPRGRVRGPVRSPSPRGKTRKSMRSPSPRERIQSPAESPSPRGRDLSPVRSPSPRGMIHGPAMSPSPRGKSRSLSRSPSYSPRR